jgi:hypothetical protein
MEKVRLNLERMLPELRDLETKKVFDRVSFIFPSRLEHPFFFLSKFFSHTTTERNRRDRQEAHSTRVVFDPQRKQGRRLAQLH